MKYIRELLSMIKMSNKTWKWQILSLLLVAYVFVIAFGW